MGESPYMQSVARYVAAIRDAAELADDVYKPPELLVHGSRKLVAAAWEMQVQYAALTSRTKEQADG